MRLVSSVLCLLLVCCNSKLLKSNFQDVFNRRCLLDVMLHHMPRIAEYQQGLKSDLPVVTTPIPNNINVVSSTKLPNEDQSSSAVSSYLETFDGVGGSLSRTKNAFLNDNQVVPSAPLTTGTDGTEVTEPQVDYQVGSLLSSSSHPHVDLLGEQLGQFFRLVLQRMFWDPLFNRYMALMFSHVLKTAAVINPFIQNPSNTFEPAPTPAGFTHSDAIRDNTDVTTPAEVATSAETAPSSNNNNDNNKKDQRVNVEMLKKTIVVPFRAQRIREQAVLLMPSSNPIPKNNQSAPAEHVMTRVGNHHNRILGRHGMSSKDLRQLFWGNQAKGRTTGVSSTTTLPADFNKSPKVMLEASARSIFGSQMATSTTGSFLVTKLVVEPTDGRYEEDNLQSAPLISEKTIKSLIHNNSMVLG